MPGVSSAPSSWLFVTADLVLNWQLAVMMGVAVVGNFSISTFTCDELLISCLAGCAILGSAALSVSVGWLVHGRNSSYRFMDSGTGCKMEVDTWLVGRVLSIDKVVVKTGPSLGARGIAEYAIGKISVENVNDRPVGEGSTPVKSLVVAGESEPRQPTLLPP